MKKIFKLPIEEQNKIVNKITRLNRIRLKREILEKDIESLQKDLKNLQKECPHIRTEKFTNVRTAGEICLDCRMILT